MNHSDFLNVLDIPAIFRVLLEVCFVLIVYTYAGYPLLLGLIAIFRRNRPAPPDYCPRLSILIAAYNEEKHIGEKIEQTLLLDYPANKLEVIVLSDASTDRTDAIVRAFGDRRVRLLRMRERRGKTHAQNKGVKAAKGEIIVFSDATTLYDEHALRYLASNFKDPRVGAVTGRNLYFAPSGGSPTGAGTMTFWSYENLVKTLQSRVHSLSGCVGCMYAVRKNAYVPLADDVISDLVEPLQLLQKRYRVLFEGRAVCYEETTKSNSHEFWMRVRVVTRGMRGLMSASELLKPWRYPWISFQLYSHKVLRWLIPVFLLLAFGSSIVASQTQWVADVLVCQTVFYLVALCGLMLPATRQWKIVSIPLYFCNLNAAAIVSLVQLVRGKRYVVWNTVRQTPSPAIFKTDPALICEEESA